MRTLRQSMLQHLFIVIAVLGIFTGLLGFYVIKFYIVERAQQEVKNALQAAESVYSDKIDKIRYAFGFYSPGQDLGELRRQAGLDYVRMTPAGDIDGSSSSITRKAFAGVNSGGTRLIDRSEISALGEDVYEKISIKIKQTPKARPQIKERIEEAMAIEYAMPLRDETGSITGVLTGGRIINGDFFLVDKIRNLVFGDELYGSKPVGTVTIFQDDTRVATNVLDAEGKRAVGTRVSESVYREVVEKGNTWLDRAFVVTDWYLTAYKPITDPSGNIIGILYVGILEQPFLDMGRNIFMAFLVILGGAMVLAVVLSFILTGAIIRPVNEILAATRDISSGDLTARVDLRKISIEELNELASSFDDMAEKLSGTYSNLKVFNDKLATLNKNYLDLIGFVSHELKGILSSTILNAYSVRDGFLGMVNFKQRKALDSITRNLDYLAATVKNFLNLSRIEKGEMSLNMAEVMLREDVVDASLDVLARQAADKDITLINEVPHGIKLTADPDMLQIVSNNLLGNAIKYGAEGGKVKVSASCEGGNISMKVYNDGRVITPEEKERLFRKFSRLAATDGKKVRGTGLGLFITKEIVAAHGGSIWVEPGEKGNTFIFTISKGE